MDAKPADQKACQNVCGTDSWNMHNAALIVYTSAFAFRYNHEKELPERFLFAFL